MKGVSLFTGIGGIELGLSKHLDVKWECCEKDDDAQKVLQDRMHVTGIHRDVTTLQSLPPDTEILTAGSPCVNFSVANVSARNGMNANGASCLISEVFRLLKTAPTIKIVILENVANMLILGKGEAVRYVTQQLEQLGYFWAYRIVDARSFGLRQRRRRLIIVARKESPPTWLLHKECSPPAEEKNPPFVAFSWVDGHRGSGFGLGCTPTIRAHDTPFKIPSQPAVISLPVTAGEAKVRMLQQEDGELLQGFPVGWTACLPEKHRFVKLGNSVAVPIFEWVGEHLYEDFVAIGEEASMAIGEEAKMPRAAWGGPGMCMHKVIANEFPVSKPLQPLQFIGSSRPLSAKATKGYLNRARKGKPGMPAWVLTIIENHLADMEA